MSIKFRLNKSDMSGYIQMYYTQPVHVILLSLLPDATNVLRKCSEKDGKNGNLLIIIC